MLKQPCAVLCQGSCFLPMASLPMPTWEQQDKVKTFPLVQFSMALLDSQQQGGMRKEVPSWVGNAKRELLCPDPGVPHAVHERLFEPLYQCWVLSCETPVLPLMLLTSTEASQAGLTWGQTHSWSPQEAVFSYGIGASSFCSCLTVPSMQTVISIHKNPRGYGASRL